MTEAIKEIIRRVIFYLPFSGEFKAYPGTVKHLFLNWLYGNGEPEFDCWFPGPCQDPEGEAG